MNSPNVLIVDDDADFAASLGDLVRARGCSVTIAVDGIDALEQYKRLAFDLVLMDRKMPRMGGVACFLEMTKQYPDAQVVMVTGHYDEQECQQAKANGLCGVLEKPVNIDHLHRILAKLKSAPVILIAEDDDICSSAVSRMLLEQGYRVRKAGNGKEAMSAISRGDIDLMILDLSMPVMNGYDVCMELKKEGSRLPIIFTTGDTGSDDMLSDILTDCSDSECIIKPISSERLYDSIGTLLRSS